jgi:type IV fimbrial biogenesis protein FimT
VNRLPQSATETRGGFSLIEMLTVVSIMGVLALFAMPRLSSALSRRDVRAAKVGLANMVLSAKMSAVATRRPVTLTVVSGMASLSMVNSSGTTQYLSAIVFSSSGVSAAPSAATLTVQPTGLITSGTPYSVTVSKNGATDSVTVTGYGRVR